MPQLEFICNKCGVQQHADGICANCGSKKLRRQSQPSGELLPCPFCGSPKIVPCNDDGRYWKRCTSCGTTGPETSKYSGEEGDPYTDWNTRAPVAVESERLKEIQERVGITIGQWMALTGIKAGVHLSDGDIRQLKMAVTALIKACLSQPSTLPDR